MLLQRERLPTAPCALQGVAGPALQAEFLNLVRMDRETPEDFPLVASGAHDTGKLRVLGEAKPNSITDHFKDHKGSVNFYQVVTVDVEVDRNPGPFVDRVLGPTNPPTPVVFVVTATHAIPIY